MCFCEGDATEHSRFPLCSLSPHRDHPCDFHRSTQSIWKLLLLNRIHVLLECRSVEESMQKSDNLKSYRRCRPGLRAARRHTFYDTHSARTSQILTHKYTKEINEHQYRRIQGTEHPLGAREPAAPLRGLSLQAVSSRSSDRHILFPAAIEGPLVDWQSSLSRCESRSKFIGLFRNQCVSKCVCRTWPLWADCADYQSPMRFLKNSCSNANKTLEINITFYGLSGNA